MATQRQRCGTPAFASAASARAGAETRSSTRRMFESLSLRCERPCPLLRHRQGRCVELQYLNLNAKIYDDARSDSGKMFSVALQGWAALQGELGDIPDTG